MLVVFQCTPRCTAARTLSGMCVVYVVLVVFQCIPRCTAARTLSGMCVLCMWCWLYFSVLLAVQQLAR